MTNLNVFFFKVVIHSTTKLCDTIPDKKNKSNGPVMASDPYTQRSIHILLQALVCPQTALISN